MTIGAVLARLQPDFPDVSISKIRFLETEGLVTPSRTGSGYRTFSEQDVERLHYILSAQRDRFWPLKVIRDALDALDRGLQPTGPDDGASRPTVPAAVLDPGLPTPQDLTRPSSLRLTAAELRQAAGLDEPDVRRAHRVRPAAQRPHGPLRRVGAGRRPRGRCPVGVRHRAPAPAAVPHGRRPRDRAGAAGHEPDARPRQRRSRADGGGPHPRDPGALHRVARQPGPRRARSTVSEYG